MAETNKLNIEDLKRQIKDQDGIKDLNQSVMVQSDGGVDLTPLLQKLNQLENSLSNKVDLDVFDDELTQIKSIIGTMDVTGSDKPLKPSPKITKAVAPAGVSKEEFFKVKQQIERIGPIEDALAKLMEDRK